MSTVKKIMFAEKLISEVKNRPVLWDKFEDQYNNRTVSDKEWARVAVVLNRDKDQIKQKWRNLRDQFLKEAKKIKVPPGATEPFEAHYQGKWMFFNNLIFLKNFVSSKKDKHKPTNSISDPSDEEVEIHEEFLHTEYEQSLSPLPGPSKDIFDDQTNNSDVIETKSEPILDPKIEFEVQSFGERKRKADDVINPAVKTIVKESSESVSEIDEDLYFVKSLVPSLKRLNPIRKLLIRNEIQNLLLRELMCDRCRLYGNQKVCQCNPL